MGGTVRGQGLEPRRVTFQQEGKLDEKVAPQGNLQDLTLILGGQHLWNLKA